MSGSGIYTDWRGYTVLPYVNPYRRTRVALDPGSLSDNVALVQTVQNVVPTEGTVVLVDFKTRVGGRVLMTSTQAGKPLPFGATVTVEGDVDNSGMVGGDGQVYLSGVPQSGNLLAKWGRGALHAYSRYRQRVFKVT